MDHKTNLALMAMLGQAMPLEMILDQLQEGIGEIKEALLLHNPEKEEEGRAHTAYMCLLYLNKISNTDPDEMVQRFEQIKRAEKLLNPDKQ